MNLREALKEIVDEEDAEHVCRPFCLYSKLADLIGADYCERDKAELLFKIDQSLSLVKRLMGNDKTEVTRIKTEFSSISDLCNRREFDEILEEAASALVAGYIPPKPAAPDDFDFGFGDTSETEEAPKKEEKVEDHLTDKSALAQFTVAQLKRYCRTHGIKGYSSLTKSELINLILFSNRKKAPVQAANRTANRPRRTFGFRAVVVTASIAAVIAGVICLVVFAKQIQWYQWQHMIGSVGGLLVCGVGFLLALAIGWLLEEVIMTDFDGYLMAPLIVIVPLAIANFVLAFVFGGAYIIIFYWLSGYLLLASLIGMSFGFFDYEAGAGIFGIIDAVTIAAMLAVQILIQIL